MIKHLVLIVLILGGCATSAKISRLTDGTQFRAFIIADEFEVLNDKKHIPKKLIQALNTEKSEVEKYVFANPNETANLTDLNYGQMPNTLIIELGRSKNVTYILFDRGGFGVTRNCMIFREFKKNVFEVYFPDIPPKIDNIEELKKYLRES